MRYLLSLTSILLLVGGCSTPPTPTLFSNSEVFDEGQEKVWSAVVETFAENNWPIEVMDKESGLMSSEWLSLTSNAKDVVDCGKGPAGETLEPATMKFNVFIKSASPGTEMKINSVYETVGGRECLSKGIIENNLIADISETLRPGFVSPRRTPHPTKGPLQIGDLAILGGGIWPQGSFSRFADPGGGFSIRGSFHTSVPTIIPWASVSGAFFSSDEALVELETDRLIILGRERRSEYAFSFHTGLQIGSPTRRGFFRPRIGISPGYYLFVQDRTVTIVGEMTPEYTAAKTFGRFGWRGFVGADLFFSTRWGLAGEFIYDQVWSLNSKRSARFQGFYAGVVIPFETFDILDSLGE